VPPGAFSYSNAGFAVVGALIEQVSGQGFGTYLHKNILAPLGMNQTNLQATPAILAALAPARMWCLSGDTPAPVFDLAATPAGNIYSTVPDMERFLHCLFNNGAAPSGQQIVGHGGAIYGYASQLMLLPKAGLGALVFFTLVGSNATANHLAADGLRMALATQGLGPRPAPRRRFGAPTSEDISLRIGHYACAETKESVEIIAKGPRLFLRGDGMPLEIKPDGKSRFFVDGHLFGDGAHYPHLLLAFSAQGTLSWKGQRWQKTSAAVSPPPAALIPYLGQYGPTFNPVILSYENGALTCLLEYFYSHTCVPLGDKRYKLQGALFPDEILQLGAQENGQPGIRVGPMFLPTL